VLCTAMRCELAPLAPCITSRVMQPLGHNRCATVLQIAPSSLPTTLSLLFVACRYLTQAPMPLSHKHRWYSHTSNRGNSYTAKIKHQGFQNWKDNATPMQV
jgi:hypothetical protein